MHIIFATATDTGRVRSTNEDAFYAVPPVFMVADGMGGAQAGEVASGTAAKAFESFTPQAGAPARGLPALISMINGEIHELASSDAERSGMGTTLTAAVVTGTTVEFAHVGDSRAYLWRGGDLTQLTEDHSLVGEMLRQGKISAVEAENHPQRSVITRALGVNEEIDVDTLSVDWKPGDLFLICSDGLSSMITDSRIAAALSAASDIEQSARDLVSVARASGGHDNITVVLFSPGHPPEKAGSGETATAAANADTKSFRADQVVAMAPAEMKRSERLKAKKDRKRTGSGGLSVRNRVLVIGAVILIFIIGSGWFANRNIYYVGEADGMVAIYRGLPLSLGPINLSSVYDKGTVSVEDIPGHWLVRVENNDLRRQATAKEFLANLTTETEKAKQEEDRSPQPGSRGPATSQPGGQVENTTTDGGAPDATQP